MRSSLEEYAITPVVVNPKSPLRSSHPWRCTAKALVGRRLRRPRKCCPVREVNAFGGSSEPTQPPRRPTPFARLEALVVALLREQHASEPANRAAELSHDINRKRPVRLPTGIALEITAARPARPQRRRSDHRNRWAVAPTSLTRSPTSNRGLGRRIALLHSRTTGHVASWLRSRAHCCFRSSETKSRSCRPGSPDGDEAAVARDPRRAAAIA